jgi:uncharacterized protein YraI
MPVGVYVPLHHTGWITSKLITGCYMKFFISLSLALIGIFLLSINVRVSAQQDCPTLVQEALAAVGNVCADTGRNEACYGNTHINALAFDNTTLPGFDTAGDKVNLINVASLETTPLNMKDSSWGVALLALQADLPDTLPGQNVIFVIFGDSQIRAESLPASSVSFPAQVKSNSNARSGPGTAYAVAGSLAAGTTVTVMGRNSASDWLKINYKDGQAWVFATLVTLQGDISRLPVVTIIAASYSAPMQAFRVINGVSAKQCAEAPRDGILIQSPQKTTVKFLINGVEVQFGSTAFLTAATDQELDVSTLEGQVKVTSAGETQTVNPGFHVHVVEGQPPDAPTSVIPSDIQGLPLQLLPQPVAPLQASIPAPEATETPSGGGSTTAPSSGGTTGAGGGQVVFPANSDWVDSGVAVTTGQSFTISATGSAMICFTPGNPFCGPYGPEGGGGPVSSSPEPSGEDYPLIGGTNAALVGRIGTAGKPFEVGKGGTFVADSSGTLQFRINDSPLRNNGGEFTVTISIGG